MHTPPPPGWRRVYVIELTDGAGARHNPQYPNVYVGETGLTLEKRFESTRQVG